MLAMPKKNFIRESYYVNGKTITAISKETGHDRKTIRKVVQTDDWSESPPSAQELKKSKLDPYKPMIDEWLTEDKRSRRKQRHTGWRVYNRLRSEEATNGTFDCSYETVNAYVGSLMRERSKNGANDYIKRSHNTALFI